VFNDRLQADGHWVFAGGLGGPDTATVIDNRGENALFTDGPFVESKEYIVGFWIMEAQDLDAALELAAQGSKAGNRKLPGNWPRRRSRPSRPDRGGDPADSPAAWAHAGGR